MALDSPVFPSLELGADKLLAHGSFAENQRRYLDPDATSVEQLQDALQRTHAGVVAHFYMDAELQGVLTRCAWPHIHISDSLVMADRAVAMAAAGAKVIVVLGVDFMAENVRAMLDASGYTHIPVYRAVADTIGCSLAESAESRQYRAYLEQAARSPHPLHVVYINTSLRTKAWAHHRVPTITCTSSNVVNTVLSAFAQQPDLDVWFGPDTYMGGNLAALFERLTTLPLASVRALHADHTPQSVAALLPRFHYFRQGTCLVHHMFGDEVARRVQTHYPEAHVVAHLEVPGEMFALGLRAQMADRGVVGSTSDILSYIRRSVARACEQPESARLSFVLGTETGMITAIARDVRSELTQARRSDIRVEIIFPVGDDAITQTADPSLPLVPGANAGEGCSTAGGCASCPYMKQNSLDALLDVLAQVDTPDRLARHRPRVYEERIAAQTIAELGTQPILFMRDFQRNRQIPAALLSRALARTNNELTPA